MIFETKNFGPIAVDESAVIEFPEGLPGFEERRRFLPLADSRPGGLVFLQSLEQPELCFLTLPVKGLRPDYQVALTQEDRETLGLTGAGVPEIGQEAAALAILSLAEGEEPTVNLRAPVVIRIATRAAVQAIRPDEQYQCREPLMQGAEALCS